MATHGTTPIPSDDANKELFLLLWTYFGLGSELMESRKGKFKGFRARNVRKLGRDPKRDYLLGVSERYGIEEDGLKEWGYPHQSGGWATALS